MKKGKRKSARKSYERAGVNRSQDPASIHPALVRKELAVQMSKGGNNGFERIVEKLNEFSPILRQMSDLSTDDEFIRELCLQAFLPIGADITMYEGADSPLSPISVSPKSIEAIIVAARCPPTIEIDRNLLREDLQLCVLCYRIESALRSNDRTKKRYEYLRRVSYLATQLRKLLTDEPQKLGIDWFIYAKQQNFEFEPLLDHLGRLSQKAKTSLAYTPEEPSNRSAPLPIVTLIGVNLPLIFGRYFRPKVGRGRSGPFIDFAVTALSAMQIKHTRNSIQKYLVLANQRG